MPGAEERLADFREEITEARRELDRLEGEKGSVMKRLKAEQDLDSAKDARKRQEKLKIQVNDLQKRFDTAVEDIEEKYGA